MKKWLMIFLITAFLIIIPSAVNATTSRRSLHLDVHSRETDKTSDSIEFTIRSQAIGKGSCLMSCQSTEAGYYGLYNVSTHKSIPLYQLIYGFTLEPGTYSMYCGIQQYYGSIDYILEYTHNPDRISLYNDTPLINSYTTGPVQLHWTGTSQRCKIFNGGTDITSKSVNCSGGYIYGTSATLALEDGNYQLTVISYEDKYNIASSPSNSITFKIDNTPPTGSGIYINNSGDQYTNNPNVNIHFNGFSDNGSGIRAISFNYNDPEAVWNNIDFATMTIPYTILTGNGDTMITAWVCDNIGNVSEPFDCTITLDTSPPANPDNPAIDNQKGFTSAGTLYWSWNSVTDNIGVKRYLVSISGSDGTIKTDTATSCYYDYNNIKDGVKYSCTIQAEDYAGNLSLVSNASEVTVDNSAPTVTLPAFPVHINGDQVKFQWEAVTDPGSGIQNYEVALTDIAQNPDQVTPLEKATTTDQEYTFTTKIRSGGKYYAWVRALDNLGNKSETWTCSEHFPGYTINGPISGIATNTPTQTFGITSTTGKELTFRIWYMNPGDSGSTKYSSLNPDTVNFIEGDWDWWLEIYEVVNGQIETDSLQITEKFHLVVDTTNPPEETNTFAIKTRSGDKTFDTENIPANTRLVSIANLNLNDNPNGSGIKGIYLWNGINTTPPAEAIYKAAEEIPVTIDWELNEGPDGLRTVNMQVVDKAGNTTLVAYQVKLDTNPPVNPDNLKHTVTDEKITLNWQFPKTEPVTFRVTYTLPNGTTNSFTVIPNEEENKYTAVCEIPVTGISPNQSVIIKLRTVDLAGNQSADELSYIAYTKATLGTLEELPSGYDTNLKETCLKWRINSGIAQSYILEYGTPTTEGFTVEGSVVGDNKGEFIHRGLTPHGTYHYRLVALNGSSDRTEGEVFTRTVPNNAPAVVGIKSPEGYSANKFKFEFTALDYDQTDDFSCRLYLKEGSGTFTELTGTEASMTIANNQEGNRIYHWVIEMNGDNPKNTINLKDNSTYYWYVEIDDNGTNGKTSSNIGQFIVDKTSPVITVEEARRPYTNQQQLNVTVTESGSGIDRVTCKKNITGAETEVTINLTTSTNGTSTGTVTLAEGQYHLHLTVYDKVGNSMPIELNNLNVDRTLPIISTVSLDITNINSKKVSGDGKLPVNFTATDNSSGIKGLHYWIVKQTSDPLGTGKILFLSPGIIQYAYTLELNGESGQEYYLAMAVEDQAGNLSAINYQGPILLDLTPPEVSFTLTGLQNYGSAKYTSGLNKLSLEASVDDPESGLMTAKINLIDVSTGETVAAAGDWAIIQNTNLTNGQKYQVKINAVNGAELTTETAGEEFIYDNTQPQNLTITGPITSLNSGEQAIFNVTAAEPESVITEYRLTLVTATGDKITSLVPENQDGWLIKHTNQTSIQYRVELPELPDGEYTPVIEVLNAVGLKNTINGNSLVINNNQEKIAVYDQGPYTMFADRLTGWWKYIGSRTVADYQFRIIDQDNKIVQDWQTITETTTTVSGLQLTNGQQYRFEVQARLTDGNTIGSGYSQGIIVDNSQPELTELITPEYSGSKNLTIRWSGLDNESGIVRIQAALGSDYYQTDISGGWIDIAENTATLTRKADGELLNLINGQRYYLTLRLTNGAGLATEKAAPGIMIDDTPPPVPVVKDQGSVINTSQYQPMEGNWLWTVIDPESVTIKYQWAVVEYGQDINNVNWQDGDPSMKVSLSMADYPREHGKTYYFAVKATNGTGLTSIGYSDGIMVDATAPIIPKVMLLDAINLGSPEAQELNYITSNQQLGIWIDSYDPETQIDTYLYTWGQPVTVDGQPRKDSDTAQISLDNPEIEEGQLTVFLGECSNEAKLVSATGYSSGVVLDIGAPVITNVKGGVSGNSLFFDWDVQASTSPVVFYEIALVPEARMNETPAAWTKTGLNRSIVLDGKDLTDGNYRLLVRGCNQAGTYSRRQGELNEWGVSPRITIDRIPPMVKTINHGQYANRQLAVEVTAQDNTSGIKGYQYALGSNLNPFQYTEGWVDLEANTGFIQFNIPTDQISHSAEIYLMVRAKDNVGLWSEPKTGGKVIIDHTVPVTPEINCNVYITNKNQITGIGYISSDSESGITHFRLGLVKNKGEAWLNKKEAPIGEFEGKLSGLTLEEAGQYYLAMQTGNGAGDWSEVGYSQLISVDTIAPELVFTGMNETIVLNNPPLAIEYTLSEAAQVQFTLTGADGKAKQFIQDGNDGSNSFDFAESIPQVYTLTAKPVDPAGNPGLEKTQLIRVNAPPQISLTEFYTQPGAPLQFKAVVIDPDSQLVTYVWNTGDGNGELTGTMPEYRYTKLGEYIVTLTVTDNDGGVTTAVTKVIVQNTTKGTLWQNESWSGIHHIYGDITIPAGVTLTIEPGTEIIVSEGSSLIVKGALNMQGGKLSAANGTTDGWNGIYIEGTADISGVTVEGSVRGITIIESAQVTIEGCIFRGNKVGLHVYGCKPTVNNCSFLDNTIYGIKEDEGGRPLVIDCRFTGNGMNYYHETLTDISMEELNGINGNRGNQY